MYLREQLCTSAFFKRILCLSPRTFLIASSQQPIVCKLVSRIQKSRTEYRQSFSSREVHNQIFHTDDGAFEIFRDHLLFPVPLRRQISFFNGTRKRPHEGETRYALGSSDWAVHGDRCRKDFAMLRLYYAFPRWPRLISRQKLRCVIFSASLRLFLRNGGFIYLKLNILFLILFLR